MPYHEVFMSEMYEMYENNFRPNETRLRMQIRRTTVLSMLMAVFQLGNMLVDNLFSNIYVGLASVVIVATSVAYFFFSVNERRNARLPFGSIAKVCSAYWFSLALCYAIFIAFDLADGHRELRNIILAFSIMTFMPFKSVNQLKRIYLIYVDLIIVIVIVFAKSDIMFCLKTAFLGLMFSVLSYSLHNSYASITSALKAEGDMDGMTKLLSKTAAVPRMKSLLKLCGRVGRVAAIYFIDIDHFKKYNDTYGHHEGDVALVKVSECIRRCFSRESDIVCRMGGEEFAVMVPVADDITALKMGRRLSRMVSELKIKPGAGVTFPVLTVSIGCTVAYPQRSEFNSPEELLSEADKQLYTAKSSGRNCIVMNGKVYYNNV